MTRVEFAKNINCLICEMIVNGESPIIDYVKRSAIEQNNLFQAGKSKCDGYVKVSKHQKGLAVDLYFANGGDLVSPKLGWKHRHDRWEKMGGEPMLEWDKGHFEA